MPGNWTKYKLSEVAQIVGGGTPSTKVEEYWNGEIPWLTPRDLTNYTYRYIVKGDRRITFKGLKNSSARLLPKNTVLLTSRAPIGYLAIAANEVCTNQGFKSFILNTEKVDPEFFYYLLKNNVEFLKSLGTGSTFAEVSASVLKSVELEFPPLETQRQVASILSSLDDKIELNLQLNQTLEKIAKAIFHERFGKYKPGDELPKGWKWGVLGEIISLEYGKALKASNRILGAYPVVGSNGVVDSHNEYLVEAPGIVIGRKGTIGKVIWLEKNFFPIDTTFYVKDLIESNGLYFHYFLLKAQNFKKIASDSAVPGLNRNEGLRNSSIVPAIDVINKFNDAVKPLFDRIALINDQNKYLTKTRNILLPRLMSGKIEVN